MKRNKQLKRYNIYLLLFATILAVTISGINLFTSSLSVFDSTIQIVYIVLICISGWITNRFAEYYILLQRYERYISTFFFILIGILGFVVDKNIVLISIPIFGIVGLLFSTYQIEQCSKITFLSGLILGGLILFFPILTYTIPIWIICLVVCRSFSVKNMLSFLFGIVIPLWFIIPILYFSGFNLITTGGNFLHKLVAWRTELPYANSIFYKYLTIYIIIGIGLITNLLYNSIQFVSDNVRTKDYFIALHLLSFYFFVLSFFFIQGITLLYCILLPISLSIGYFVSKTHHSNYGLIFSILYTIVLIVGIGLEYYLF